MAVLVLETQMAAATIRLITKGSNLSFHCGQCPGEGYYDADEDSSMQSDVHNLLLQFFELTVTSTLLSQLLLITDHHHQQQCDGVRQCLGSKKSTSYPATHPDDRHWCPCIPCPTCHPGRACDDQFIAVQSAASFSCEDDQWCDQYVKKVVTGSSRATKKFQLPAIFTCPDGGHRCPYIPCPVCHPGRYSRMGKFEDHKSSADNIIFNGIIKCEAGSRMTVNQLPAITGCPDGGWHRCPYIPCPVCHPGRSYSRAGKHHEDRDSSSADDILGNVNIKCEVKYPVACPDPHVCKEFPCKECHRVRPNPNVQFSSDQVVITRKESGLITSQAPTTCPDGGRHRCTYFPCPICHPGRYLNGSECFSTKSDHRA